MQLLKRRTGTKQLPRRDISSVCSGIFPVRVGKTVNEHQELWYQRTFDVPSAWKGKQILLHFGAVDWKADVWVNDVKVGQHTGGFTPFYFDITSALNKGNNQLVVKVWDPLTVANSREESK